MSKQFYVKQFSLALVRSLYIETILFQVVHFSIITHFSSIWLIDRTQSGATTPGQSGAGSNGNERVLCIFQSSSITVTSQSDCLVSYPGHSLGTGLTALQRCSRCILQSQLTEQGNTHTYSHICRHMYRQRHIFIYIYIYIYIYT